MDDGEMLLRSILDNPAEDTPRLVYADWLDEQGEELRAEFIRLQVRRHELNELFKRDLNGLYETVPEWGRQMAAMGRRIRELWHMLPTARVFLPPFAVGLVTETDATRFSFGGNGQPVDQFDCVVRRGFVAEVTCDAASWLTHADDLLARHPVERVVLTGLAGADITRMCELIRERQPGKWSAMSYASGSGTLYILRHLWPRIAFELPEQRVAPEWAINDLLVNPPPR